MIDWKERALVRAKEFSGGEPVEVYLCPKTDIELYFQVGERRFVFESLGTCTDCEQDFHVSAIKKNGDQAAWPIHYVGCYCNNCYYKDDVVVELNIEESDEVEEEAEEETSEETSDSTE